MVLACVEKVDLEQQNFSGTCVTLAMHVPGSVLEEKVQNQVSEESTDLEQQDISGNWVTSIMNESGTEHIYNV